jgi:hypothetical protein
MRIAYTLFIDSSLMYGGPGWTGGALIFLDGLFPTQILRDRILASWLRNLKRKTVKF